MKSHTPVRVLDGHPFYFKDLNRKFVVYDKNSCFCFGGESKFRQKVVWFMSWCGFDNFIIAMIFINSITLAIQDYNDRDSKTKWNKNIETIGQVFSAIFFLEAATKIIGMGFIMHKNSYLRDLWNCFDFLIVVVGIIEWIPGIPNLKALRTIRVLRPLRSINAFPSMKRLIESLLASIPSLE